MRHLRHLLLGPRQAQGDSLPTPVHGAIDMPAAINQVTNQVIDTKGVARVESFRQADSVKTIALISDECHVIEIPEEML